LIKINGEVIHTIDPGSGPPYSQIPFDVDISSYIGEYIIMEFSFDGDLAGAGDGSDWDDPVFNVTP